jgi:hypothetical protein
MLFIFHYAYLRKCREIDLDVTAARQGVFGQVYSTAYIHKLLNYGMASAKDAVGRGCARRSADNRRRFQRFKSIDIRFHFIRDVCNCEGKVIVDYIPTADQPVDVLTKDLYPQVRATMRGWNGSSIYVQL